MTYINTGILLMRRQPPKTTRTYTLCPYTTRFRSRSAGRTHERVIGGKHRLPPDDPAAEPVAARRRDDGEPVRPCAGDPQCIAAAARSRHALDRRAPADHRRARSPRWRAGGEAVTRPHPRPGRPRGEARRVPELTLRKRSEEHTSELQSLMRNSYAVFSLTK